MDGSANGAVAHHDRRGRFVDGNTEYRAKQQRIAERVRQLSLDYDPSPSQRMWLPIIAKAMDDAERGRTVERRTRAANTAGRLLRQFTRKEAPSLPTWSELERRHRQKEATP
jgi:hypothetical protein